MNKKGISFIEIIISTLIIAMLAAGMLGAFAGARYFFNHEKHRLQAFNFARTVLDKLRSDYQWADTEMASGAHAASDIGISALGEMANLIATPATDFKYDVVDTQADGYKTVTVTVKWNEPRL